MERLGDNLSRISISTKRSNRIVTEFPPLTPRAAGGNQIFCDAKVIWNAIQHRNGYLAARQNSKFLLHQPVKQGRFFGSALSLHAVRAVRAQVIRVAYKSDRSERIRGQLSFDKGHVSDEFFAVAMADKGLKTEEMMGTEVQPCYACAL